MDGMYLKGTQRPACPIKRSAQVAVGDAALLQRINYVCRSVCEWLSGHNTKPASLLDAVGACQHQRPPGRSNGQG